MRGNPVDPRSGHTSTNASTRSPPRVGVTWRCWIRAFGERLCPSSQVVAVAPDRDHEFALPAIRASLSPVAVDGLRDVRDRVPAPFDLPRQRFDDPNTAGELLALHLVVLDAVAEPPRDRVQF